MTKWFILIPCHLCDLSVECCVTEEFLSKTKRPPAEKVQRSAGARTAAKLWFHLKWMRQHNLKNKPIPPQGVFHENGYTKVWK